MGKRSRRQSRPAADHRRAVARQPLRQRVVNASAGAQRAIEARPQAPWHPFPLTELAVFVGLIGAGTGLAIGGRIGNAIALTGLVLVCAGGLETALREHRSGYRPHGGLLAGVLAVSLALVAGVIPGMLRAVQVAIMIGIFALVFPTLRRDFIKRSKGRRVL